MNIGSDIELVKRVVLKLDLLLLPFLCLLFLLNSLDKSNVGNAESGHFTEDLGLPKSALNVSVAWFFAVFVSCQPIGAYYGRKYVAFVGFFWLPHSANTAWFLTADERLVAEERIRRDQIAAATSWVNPKQQSDLDIQERRSSNLPEPRPSLTLEDDEADYLLPNAEVTQPLARRPSHASVLSVTADSGVSREDIFSAVADWKVWYLLFCNILSAIPATAFAVFLPLVIKGIAGRDDLGPAAINLLVVPPFLAGAIILWIFTWWSDRHKTRLIPILYGLAILLAGLAATVALPTRAYKLRYLALTVLLSGSFVASPLTVTWLSNNIPQPGKRAIVLGINGWGNFAGVISSMLFAPRFAEDGYIVPFYATLACVLTAFVGYLAFRALVVAENHGRNRIVADWDDEEVRREAMFGDAHQILGRVSTVLFYLHAGFYLNFFVQAHVLAKRIKDWDVILGLIGTVAFTAVGTTALSPLRKWSYRVFYTTHVTLASILLPMLYLHVSHIRIYIIETLIVYALHLALRILNEHKVQGSLTLVPGTANLLEINISITQKAQQQSFMQYQPGQHVYISLAQAPLYKRTLKSKNPFTIASLPSSDGTLKLIARVLNNNTAALAKSATEGATGKATSIPLILEGPYGLSTHPDTLLQYNRVLFIAGGVGATFVVPLYRTLLRDLSPSPGSRRRQNVAFVWVVRDEAETSWAIPEDEQERQGMQERMTVYATRSGRMDSEEHEQKTNDADEGIELERLLPSGDINDSTRKWQIHPGRPDLGQMLDGVFSHTRDDTKVAVLVCGPRSMADEVRRKTQKWVDKRDVWLHVEAFGL
ncbi:unnamed protein product [Aureobasidium vineae]|uniref:FAD-binding FR-type domain-containing protein n=1 Tax=Aureobasidium vineae TaxID=2773715 RepID=A0A9N8JP03_9PEZI|nr:unnamed protein product [Aureobasidium vineae]